MKRIIDLSYDLHAETPVFANYGPPEITILDFTGNSATPNPRAINSSRLEIGLQCGTHMDASPFETHLVLLGSGVLIVENLTNLEQIGAERFIFAAFPLKIRARDGSPVRAIATDLDDADAR